MTIWQGIILGLVQGVSEFLPISSSGHLLILPKLFNWAEQGVDFDVAVHVATLAAIIVIMWRDIVAAARTPRLLALLAVATVPIAIVGATISDEFLDTLRSPLPVAISLIVWGIALAIADMTAKHFESKPSLATLTWPQVIFIGFAQMIALIPGTSRSGITMTAGMVKGLDRESATRFSFLLAIPAIAGAGVLTARDVMEHGLTTDQNIIIAGAFAAFIAGLLSLKLLFYVAKRIGFGWFAFYRVLIGIIILIWLV